ncbi:MAG: 3-deoxy-D-manno-octulosonic acid transferase, partial [Gammaproteobacteria bacterium]|nr:3-deoxy-D-manno-octulosonic acid transferase [Gammaproteobacteria bacterium]
MLWRALYSVLVVLAWPLVWMRLRMRGIVNPTYRDRRAERFGCIAARVPRRVIWFHTVSAGETIAAAPLVRALMERFPQHAFLLTTMTPTGSAQAQRLLPEVTHCYAPYDFPWAVRRFLDRVEPQLLVLMETELWPNLVRLSAARGTDVVLANARLSERSARGYRLIRALTQSMLHDVAWIGCQFADHRTRFVALGADPATTSVIGSVKFDQEQPADLAERAASLRAHFQLGARRAWVAASTHEGEDTCVLRAHVALLEEFPDLVLLLIPRHPERFDTVLRLVERSGLRVGRRSAPTIQASSQVIVGDSMGELMSIYALAEVAFVGGSLVDAGGHNPIEPAALGLPVLMGPYVANFAEVVQRFVAGGALVQINEAHALTAAVAHWLR